MSSTTQGHHLYKLCSTRIPDATYHVSRRSTQLLRTGSHLKALTIYGHGSHLDHVNWTKYVSFLAPLPGGCT